MYISIYILFLLQAVPFLEFVSKCIQHYTWTQIQVKEQLVVRMNMDVNEHERLSNIILGHKFKRIVSHVHLHPYSFLLQAVPLLEFVS
jgi:hypothetical protein